MRFFLSSLVDGKKIKENAAVLDVGSGTGAVSLCLAARLSEKKLKITGLDIQADLVKLSNQSSVANGFADFLHYEYADIRNGGFACARKFRCCYNQSAL